MRKINGTIILSILALVISVAVAMLLFFEVEKTPAIDTSSYISIIVTLLGIIVTVVLGWQIYNVIDFKEKVTEIDVLKMKLERSSQIQEENNNVLQEQIVACAKFYSGNYADSLVSFMSVLRVILNRTDYSFEINEAEITLETLKKILETTPPIRLYLNCEQYTVQHFLIQESNHYKNVRKEYEEFYSELMAKIENDETRKYVK